jgi:hypothetical protein
MLLFRPYSGTQRATLRKEGETMKHLTMSSMFAAAAVVLAAGSASAQTLKADVPFTFQAAGVVMTPGTYEIRHASKTANLVVLRNTDTKNSVLMVYSSADASKEVKSRGTPALGFECSGARCAIREMWTASGIASYRFRGPKLAADGDTRMAMIPLTAVKAD